MKTHLPALLAIVGAFALAILYVSLKYTANFSYKIELDFSWNVVYYYLHKVTIGLIAFNWYVSEFLLKEETFY